MKYTRYSFGSERRFRYSRSPPVVSKRGRHSLHEALPRPSFKASKSYTGSAVARMPLPANTADKSSLESLPMEGNSRWTMGSYRLRLLLSEETKNALPVFSNTIRAGLKSLSPRDGRPMPRYLSTISRNASMRVLTPASAVWLSSSRVSEGLVFMMSRK